MPQSERQIKDRQLNLLPVWEEGIYQFEYTDPILGYNPQTGINGIANEPPRQLGNRTEYLKNELAVAHDFLSGHHRLTNADFVEYAGIREDQLKLDAFPEDLRTDLDDILARISSMRAEHLQFDSANLFTFQTLSLLIPRAWHYHGGFTMLELFCSFKFQPVPIYEAIEGDDSLDVQSTETLEEGREYALCNADDTNVEIATVKEILDLNRVRFTKPLKYSRQNGYVSDTTLQIKNGIAKALSDWVYTSEEMSHSFGTYSLLVVNREKSQASAQAWYRNVSNGTWLPLGYLRNREFFDNTIDEVWALPSDAIQFRVMFTSQKSAYPYLVNHIFVIPKDNNDWIEQVRRPNIEVLTWCDNSLKIQATKYGSLYREAHKYTEVFITDGFAEQLEMSKKPVTSIEIQINPELQNCEHLLVQIRYIDVKGNQSRWSIVHDVRRS